MPKFTASLNLPQYSSAPSSPSNGDMYYNTTDNKVYSRINGAWVDLAATGGGGGGATVYYQTSAPLTPTTGDIWVDSDDNTVLTTIPVGSTSQQGIVQLNDSTSSTSTTTAATANSVRSAAYLANGYDYWISTRTSADLATVPSIPKWSVTSTFTFVAGNAYFNSFIPYKDMTVSSIMFPSGSRAAIGTTLARFCIATRSGTNMTIVARTASDTTIMSSTLTRYLRNLDTTGGFPATYNLVAGTEYMIGIIFVGSTTTPIGFSGPVLAANFFTPSGRTPCRVAGSQTDLVDVSAGSGFADQLYFELA